MFKVTALAITLLYCSKVNKATATRAVKPSIRAYSEQELIDMITRAEIANNLPRGLLRRIIAHESKFKVNAVNKHTLDYGLGQINHKTAKALGLDIPRLTVDPEYNIAHSARILKSFQRSHGHEPTWACRYNIGYRDLTDERVSRTCRSYLNKIYSK